MSREDLDSETGEVLKLGGIWDYRDDPEGILFADGEIDVEKAKQIEALQRQKTEQRLERLGFVGAAYQAHQVR